MLHKGRLGPHSIAIQPKGKQELTISQLKNHWKQMLLDHKMLFELLRCTCVEYDRSSGNRVVADDEWWERKIMENPKNEGFKNKDMGEICDRYSRLFRDTFDSSKYVFTLTNLLRRRFGMQNDSDSDQVTDCLPLPLESSSSSDELDIDRSNASKARSSKRSGSKRKSTSSLEKGRKNMGHVRSRLQ
ncbi:Hypothetical predicted protein [Olea europaea subsp. europaea]|uniref:Myb/SANT-like domain-containing protein n=1 Tax=Olea europaea subsp. europaea TaxID=158383 RepID=A0A8S0VNC0_OLEEU|nr:Hypothetical predicted protein [Olea europaea subsp. europaea]